MMVSASFNLINCFCPWKAISGLLSLGYEIGAILHRRTATWYDASGLQVTKESIKELQKDYIQIKVFGAFILHDLVHLDL